MSLVERIKAARHVYLIGNGGSYANAMHIANDLLSCGVRAFTMDPATFSAFANDHGYDKTFAMWLQIVGKAGDLLIALSGSGKSPNILLAVEVAEKIGMDVHKEFGAEQGLDMQQAEEAQIKLGHDLMRQLKCV